ncbi:MAG: hypothetical protein IKY01_00935 [Prevotella sp.]|nr:hypothetical protein [Prevotella sp.]
MIGTAFAIKIQITRNEFVDRDSYCEVPTNDCVDGCGYIVDNTYCDRAIFKCG